MLGYTLALGTRAAWWNFTLFLVSRLSPQERVLLAHSALMALPLDVATATAEIALWGEERRAAA